MTRPRSWCTALLVVLCLGCCSYAGEMPRELTFGSRRWDPLEESGRWCGAKALWLVAHGYGLDWDLQRVKELCGPDASADGATSLAAMQQAATEMGLAAVPLRCGLDWLKHNRLGTLTIHNLEHPSRCDPKGVSVDHCLLLLAPTPSQLPQGGRWGDVVFGLAAVNLALWGAALVRWRRVKLLSGVTAAVLTALVAGCSSAATPPGALEFQFTRHEPAAPFRPPYGRRPVLVVLFPFQNTADRPVTITGVTADCACVHTGYVPAEVRPGQSGQVALTADLSAREGYFESSARVQTVFDDGQPAAPVLLSLAVYYAPAPFTEPGALDLGDVAAGHQAQRTFRLVVPLGPDEPCPPTAVTADEKRVRCALSEPRIEKHYGRLGRAAIWDATCSLLPAQAGTQLETAIQLRVEGLEENLQVPLRARIVPAAPSVGPR